MIDRSIAVARAASDGVVVVVPPEDADREGAVAGGDTRSDSVRAGLAAVPADATIICVHDAARPLASAEVYRRAIDAVRNGADAAIPSVAVADTIKIVADGVVVSTPDRSTLVAVQTPQAFRADVLRTAHGAGGDATDDAALVEQLGARVVVVDGEATNRKITVPDDLAWARELLTARQAVGRGRPRRGGVVVTVPEFRVGQGFDVHRFSTDPERVMVLGGCHFDGVIGLEGHSDADAVAHACADALLGAAGLGDIGMHFPDTDERWSGADSMALLRHVTAMLAEDGWRAVNIDCADRVRTAQDRPVP